jgi:uncharacterized membrane protein YfcA
VAAGLFYVIGGYRSDNPDIRLWMVAGGALGIATGAATGTALGGSAAPACGTHDAAMYGAGSGVLLGAAYAYGAYHFREELRYRDFVPMAALGFAGALVGYELQHQGLFYARPEGRTMAELFELPTVFPVAGLTLRF